MSVGINTIKPTQGNERVNKLADDRNEKRAEQRDEKTTETRQKTQSINKDSVDFTI